MRTRYLSKVRATVTEGDASKIRRLSSIKKLENEVYKSLTQINNPFSKLPASVESLNTMRIDATNFAKELANATGS
jgi:hypothetical protein